MQTIVFKFSKCKTEIAISSSDVVHRKYFKTPTQIINYTKQLHKKHNTANINGAKDHTPNDITLKRVKTYKKNKIIRRRKPCY